MKMMKLFGIITLALLISVPAALACHGPECGEGEGNFKIKAKAYGKGFDIDGKLIKRGAAGGLSSAKGYTTGGARGYVYNADASGKIDVSGGGLASTTAYKFDPEVGDHGKGVGSSSYAYGETTASLKLKAKNADGWYDWGFAHGGFHGCVRQLTLDGSIIVNGKKWDSKGLSAGVAGQMASGHIYGDAMVDSWIGYNGKVNLKAGIIMDGASYSESYRFVAEEDGVRVEGMGTNVGARTDVETFRKVKSKGWGYGYVGGSFNAKGGAAALTVQKNDNGKAVALAVGTYQGSGRLGCNFSGSVQGGTYTNAMKVEGMNGTVMSSGASMSVSSHMSGKGGNRPD